jgi:hypothetical protein
VLSWLLSGYKASHIAIIAGVLVCVFACFEIDFSKSFPVLHPLQRPSYIVLAVGVLLLVAGVFVLRRDRPPSIKLVAGKWTYSVIDCDIEHDYTHSGVAEIFQEGQRIRFEGSRRRMAWRDNDGQHEQNVNIHWRTSWGFLDEEGVLRYDYDMPLPGRGGRIMGYVRIQIAGEERHPTEMSGNYYMLPPFADNLPNTRWGSITWVRVAEKKPRWWNRSGAKREQQPPQNRNA